MPYLQVLGLAFGVIAKSNVALADKPPLECEKKSLAQAVAEAHTGETITFTGVCTGPITVRTDRFESDWRWSATIDGNGHDALAISGAHQVSLTNLEVRNGLTGITGVNGAHISLTGVKVHDNAVFGISLQTASSAILSEVTSTRNGVHGLDLQTGSAATITGNFTSSDNRVFGSM